MTDTKHTPEPKDSVLFTISNVFKAISYARTPKKTTFDGDELTGKIIRKHLTEYEIIDKLIEEKEFFIELQDIPNPAEWVRILKEERVESHVSYWKEKAENSDWRYKEVQSENERLKAELEQLKGE